MTAADPSPSAHRAGALAPALVVDGGDRACGELLLLLADEIRRLQPGAGVRLVATDPAASIDLPAWCHLTGHRFVRVGRQADRRPHYDLQVSATPRSTRPTSPWRLDDQVPAATSARKDTTT